MTEPTGSVALLLMLIYLAGVALNLVKYVESITTVESLVWLLLTTVSLWGMVSCMSYSLDKQCPPYSGALECYYEN